MSFPRRTYYPEPNRLPSVLILLLLLMLAIVLPAWGETPPLSLSSGDLPLLIVAGHGGQEKLVGAEVRDEKRVHDPHFVLFGDFATNTLAEEIASAVALAEGGGHRPSLLLNNVHRRYSDVNRAPEITSQDPLGVAHDRAFHALIDAELARLKAEYGWALLLDIHGQSKYETTLLLGTGDNSVVQRWSLEKLWGASGLVEALTAAGFTVAPPTSDGAQRYPGGYTVRHHGLDVSVEAWQMEHSSALRKDPEQRARYARVLASALVKFLAAPPNPR